MATTTIQPGITVEELPDLDASVPCEAIPPLRHIECGAPAVARVRVRADCCSITTTRFICQPCLDNALRVGIACRRHGTIITLLGRL